MTKTLSKIVNPDLDNERKKCNFDVEELAQWWHGGKQNLQEKRKIEQYMLDDPELQDAIPTAYLSHKELYEQSVRKLTLILKKLQKFHRDDKNWQNKDYMQKIYEYRSIFVIISGLIKDGNPISVHISMFLTSLLKLGTEEQQIKWFNRAWNFNIFGTYAQTELGHGTFLRGLETTATYDLETKEFIINSPTLTSFKWWPGMMGKTTNHAIVVAQLYIKGKCYGIHHFIVQTRDEETAKPLHGIQIGEIGPILGKINFNNGYLGMNNIRVPRNNMLMRNAQVLDDGTYVKSPSSVLNYSTMMYVRTAIITDMSANLSKAATIATRYSAVRRQSPIDVNKPEVQIIEHVTQQYKLFPCIAKCLVFKLTAKYIWELYNQVNGELDRGVLERLPELHALLSCLKATCTSEASAGVEVLRMACGGHGYMESSNFPTIYSQTTMACTYEGENTVLLLQTARFLTKSWSQHLSGGKLVPTVYYFRNSNNKTQTWDKSITGIIGALQLVAANKIRLSYEKIEQQKKLGHIQEEASNFASIQLVQAAEAHAKVILAQSAYAMTKNIDGTMSTNLITIIQQLVEIYVVDMCLKSLGDLFRFTNLTHSDAVELQQRLENLFVKIRPNAIGFVDGFDFHDVSLSSTLGSYDGNVYERLFAEAQKSPLNQQTDNGAFEKYLKTFMKSNL